MVLAMAKQSAKRQDAPLTPSRNTRQKEALAHVLDDAGRALSMEEILSEARKLHPTVSERTVFRRLADMMADRELLRVYLPGQPPRYERPTWQHRPHLVCRGCQQVFVLPTETPTLLDTYPCPPGFQLVGEEVTFYGYCPDCPKPEPTGNLEDLMSHPPSR